MKLEELDVQHEKHFLELMNDLRENDSETYALQFPEGKWDSAAFKKYVKECQKQRQDWRPTANKISHTHYVLIDPADSLLAFCRMSFPLDDKTELDGGNLYVLVPSAKRKDGNGSFCLSLLLFEAVRAGLRRVLVTCPSANTAARRMIEKNRGAWLDEVESKHPHRKGLEIARYWISFR